MCISSTTMRPSVAENHIVNVSKLMHAGQYNVMHERSASSLSTEFNSEFEFHSSSFSELINDIEPPLSPKLVNYSPKLYSPNYSVNGETTAEMASSNQFSADQRNIPASIKADQVQEQQLGFEDYIEAPAPSVSRINNIHESANAGEEIKKRVDLGFLFNRRNLKQLLPATNYIIIESNDQRINKKDMKKLQVVVPVKGSSPSSSSASPSSSPISYHANHSANCCKFDEDNQGDTSPSDQSKIRQKKSRKWAFKLDFLRKGAYQAPTQNRNGEHDNYSIAEEAGFDEYFHERDNGAASAAGEGSINIENYGLNKRIDHYRAAAAASEARFNHQINQSIDNNRVAAAVITKFESRARHSTSSVISSVSSSPGRAHNEMIRANHRKISTSARISPAGSPPRSSTLHAGDGAFTRGRAPMSPHALHYEQQRARWEVLRRKTFLPYRQSLLSACFNPPQAVY